MIRLYHGGPRGHSASVLIMLAEKAIPFESHLIDLAAYEQHEPDFLAINPDGQVPVLDADGQILTETFFILQYLDERYPELPLTPADPKARYTADKWGKYVETHIAPNLALYAWALRGTAPGALVRENVARLTPERQLVWRQACDGFGADEIEAVRAAVDKAIGRVAEDLAGPPWLAGAHYSVADIAVFPHLARARDLGFAMPAPVADWLARIATRPAVRAALGEDGGGADVPSMGPESGRWG